MNSWELRDLIINITHRWYVIIVFILLGSAAGWVASVVLPSPYQASIDLYVGINAYRSPYDSNAETLSGQPFRLVDDYKNWQMEQLDELVKSDDYLKETLTLLQSQGSDWDNYSTQDFRERADVLWRNAGEWHFVVRSEDPNSAVQAVEIWEDVILERTNIAINHAKKVVALDVQMTAAAESRIESELRQGVLVYVRDEITRWRKELASLSSDQVVPAFDHWRFLSLVSQASNQTPLWNRILETSPAAGSTGEIYEKWSGGALAIIDEELKVIPEQISILDKSFSKHEEQYKIETAGSMGLASTLIVERIDVKTPQVEIVRESGTLALLGGLIGLLIWAIWAFIQIGRNKNTGTQ